MAREHMHKVFIFRLRTDAGRHLVEAKQRVQYRQVASPCVTSTQRHACTDVHSNHIDACSMFMSNRIDTMSSRRQGHMACWHETRHHPLTSPGFPVHPHEDHRATPGHGHATKCSCWQFQTCIHESVQATEPKHCRRLRHNSFRVYDIRTTMCRWAFRH